MLICKTAPKFQCLCENLETSPTVSRRAFTSAQRLCLGYKALHNLRVLNS